MGAVEPAGKNAGSLHPPVRLRKHSAGAMVCSGEKVCIAGLAALPNRAKERGSRGFPRAFEVEESQSEARVSSFQHQPGSTCAACEISKYLASVALRPHALCKWTGEALSRVRGCLCIRLAERPRLFGKRFHLRLHELSLNSKNLLKVLGLA
jgi:hypothetical protein